jgi:hypothetical protein
VATHAYLIFIIYCIPVKTIFVLLIVEEAIVLIDNLPKRFEVSLGGVVVFDFVYTGNGNKTEAE